jgi:hypothetical protein
MAQFMIVGHCDMSVNASSSLDGDAPERSQKFWFICIAASIAIFIGLIALGVAWLNSALYVDSPDACILRDLRISRGGWLKDGCPPQPNPEIYPLGDRLSATNYFMAPIVAGDKKYYGLFAENWHNWHSTTNTYIITTTGAILIRGSAGTVSLFRKETQW